MLGLSFEGLSRGVDDVIAILSPEIAIRRSRMRAAQKQIRLYDGATKGRRAGGWRPIADGPRESIKGLADLRSRSRDFSRNNGYALRAVHAIAANTIGTGIVLQVKPKRKNGKAPFADYWKKWSESTFCDFDGLNTFAGIQELIVKTIVESGEVIIRKTLPDANSSISKGYIPLQLQVLEPEILADVNQSADAGGNQIISGVEFNSGGKKVAYHLYPAHPSLGLRTTPVRVPASEIIHLFRVDRPGQVRGVPWAAPIMLNLHDLDGYEDAELLRKRIAACFTAFVSSGDIDDSSAQTDEPPLIDKMEPGIVERLAPGETVTFGTPPASEGYESYTRSILHKCASGYQVPYFVLTQDYSQVNFSSARMSWLEFQRLIESWRWNLIIPRGLNSILDWVLEASAIFGIDNTNVSTDWTAPRREMIDPEKEINAILLGVKGGLITMPEAIREAGYDPDSNIEAIKEWNAQLDAAKIILDSDPRQDPKRLAAKNLANTSKVD